jgi:nucleoside-diphosphate-sugar epimerase
VTIPGDSTLPTILLTGASGVVGQSLLERMQPERVTCLVHRRGVNRPARELPGDVSRPRLGLDRGAFDELARSIDVVVHSAALTDFQQPHSRMHEVNVAAVENVLELAERADAPLCHVSTAFVAQHRPDLEPDDFAKSQERGGAAGYVASKVAGERVVRDSALPHAIMRPSIVMGDADTGRTSEFQGLHAFAGLMLQGNLPMVPVGPTTLADFVARDTVAATIVALVDSGQIDGEHYVSAGDRAPLATEMVAACAAVAKRLGLEIDSPRLVGREIIDRLFRPVFIPRLPPRTRRRFLSMVELTELLDSEDPLPSSMHELERRLGLPPAPDPIDVLTHSCEYWAHANGLGDPTIAEAA